MAAHCRAIGVPRQRHSPSGGSITVGSSSPRAFSSGLGLRRLSRDSKVSALKIGSSARAAAADAAVCQSLPSFSSRARAMIRLSCRSMSSAK